MGQIYSNWRIYFFFNKRFGLANSIFYCWFKFDKFRILKYNYNMEIENQNVSEFKVGGLTMEKLSIYYGLFLILWGVIVSFISGSGSMTSYIPSLLGIPILIFSYLSIKFVSKKKMFMHIVVLFGLIIVLGGLDFVRTFVSGNAFVNFWADLSKIMMLITGLFFTYQCVKSFIHARKIRESENSDQKTN